MARRTHCADSHDATDSLCTGLAGRRRIAPRNKVLPCPQRWQASLRQPTTSEVETGEVGSLAWTSSKSTASFERGRVDGSVVVVTFQIVCLAAMTASFFGGGWFLFPAAGILVALSGPALRRSLTERRERRGRIRAEPGGLFVDDVLLLSREDIRSGQTQPRGNLPMVVRLLGRRAFTDLEVVVTGSAEGSALLQALRLDVTHQVATFSLRQGVFANPRCRMKRRSDWASRSPL